MITNVPEECVHPQDGTIQELLLSVRSSITKDFVPVTELLCNDATVDRMVKDDEVFSMMTAGPFLQSFPDSCRPLMFVLGMPLYSNEHVPDNKILAISSNGKRLSLGTLK